MTGERRARATGMAAFLMAATLVGGCGDSTTAPQATANANTVRVKVTVKSVYVIAECEGTTGTNPGDFTFELHCYTNDPDIPERVFNGTFSGLKGQTVDIPDIVIQMDRVPKKGDWFDMEFRVTELDNGVPDPRMNDSRSISQYAWPTGDTLEEDYPQEVTGSSACSVQFTYGISASRVKS
jgi:hypothetical protein